MVANSMDHAALAIIAQQYLAAPPTFVVGSGATIPLGLPSMPALAEQLVSLIPADPVPPGFDRWAEFATQISSGVGLEEALHSVEMPPVAVRKIVDTTWNIVNKACLGLHASLMESRSSPPLSRLFRHFSRVANHQTRVITTNYDRVVEYAADRAGLTVFSGFRFEYLRGFATQRQFQQPRADVLLWKVHGSLDWFRFGGDELFSYPLARAIPANAEPVIVTPGLSKYRETYFDPFRTTIIQADEALQSAASILCIGFGFNDDHIQPRLLERARQTNTPIVVISRSLTPATHSSLLNGSCNRYLAIEMHDDGSRIYTDRNPDPIDFPGTDFWSIDGFSNLLLGVETR